MKYTAKTGSAASASTACLVVHRAAAQETADALGIGAQARLALAGTKNEVGAVVKLFREGKPSRLIVVGKDGGQDGGKAGGKEDAKKPYSEAQFRKDMDAAAGAVAALDVADATLAMDGFAVADRSLHWKARTALAAVSHACYRVNAHKSKKTPAAKLRRVSVLAEDRAAARLAVRQSQALDDGLAFAKNLGNQPPNVCNPTFVAETAQSLADDDTTVTVLDEDEMAELGMGAFLSVSQGSETPGKLVIVDYQGAKGPPCVLVGKGITFDTGGISLKPSGGMGDMKFDMSGAAAVLGTAKAAIGAKLPIRLVAIAAAAENMPSGRATRPSDIVTTLSGQTVEILNTDAEGRLVLCDALTYAERFKPKAVVDVATLTGAQVVALGSPASALYANDDALAEALLAAGQAAHDRLWRMPLWDDYQKQLKSAFADMKNIGGREAGSITAACFLSRFAKAFPWAHLDIAGTAYKSGKGSTGRPVAALFEFLLNGFDGLEKPTGRS